MKDYKGTKWNEIDVADYGNLIALLRQYKLKVLRHLARTHGMPGYSQLGKDQLAMALARYILQPQIMKRYFSCADDQEIKVYEQLAAQAGTLCSLTEKGSDYLYMGGYCMETTDGQLMVPAAVAKAYEHINTEKFHKRRRLVYRVWSYMNAAIYLYGICRPGQITALYNLHESDVLPEPELHGIFRELEPVRGRFIYQNGWFADTSLVESGAYRDVLCDQKGIRAFVPDREMIREIGEMGLCEPDRQLMPMINFFLRNFQVGREAAAKDAFEIHHMIRFGADGLDVSNRMAELGMILDSDEKASDFEQTMDRVWNDTRQIGLNGHTRAEVEAMEAQQDPDRPCPCGSGKRYRQCCGRGKGRG